MDKKSNWKGKYCNPSFFLKTFKIKSKKQLPRNTTIPKKFLNTFLFIHIGNITKKIYITKEKIGNKIGSFGFTRSKKSNFKIKKKKK